MRGTDRVALDGDLEELVPVEEQVDGRLAVAARHDHRARPQLVNSLRKLGPRALPRRERLRLVQVRRHDRREGEEPRDERPDRVVLEQLRARARDHHRVDDERHRVLLEVVGHGLDQPTREQHPGLRRVDAEIREHCLELVDDELRRQLVDRLHPDGVLRGERDQDRHAVHARAGERLQVGLNPGAAARVGGRDRQCPRYHRAPFAGRTGETTFPPWTPFFVHGRCHGGAPAGRSPAPPSSGRYVATGSA
jgi:hypothetical protein